ncbi:DUF2057 family protein [Thalassotalea fusca]
MFKDVHRLSLSLVGVVAIAFTSFIANGAKLHLPENFRALSVNGEERNFSFFALSSSLELWVGTNVIELQYRELFDGDEDDTIKVSSRPFTIELMLTKDEDIFLKAPIFEQEDRAREYAKSPEFLMVDEKNKKVQFKRVLKTQTAVDKTLEKDLTEPAKVEEKQVEQVTVNSTNTQINSLTMLKHWWHQATPEQKQAFANYIDKELEDK